MVKEVDQKKTLYHRHIPPEQGPNSHLRPSFRLPIVELQQATEPLSAFDGSLYGGCTRGEQEHIASPLVVAFFVIVDEEFIHRVAQVGFAEEHEL